MVTLTGKQGLIVGVANEHRAAYGRVRSFVATSTEPAIVTRQTLSLNRS